MDDVASVSAGNGFSLILKEDKSVWAMGRVYYTGFFAEDIFINEPVKIIENVRGIKAGFANSFYYMYDHSLWGSGLNIWGQLGTGSLYSWQIPPVKIIDDVKSFSSVYGHTLVIKNNNSVWGTGMNDRGQLGDNTREDKNVFVLLQ